MEVWSIHHKSDGNPWLSLEILTDTGVYQPKYNAVFGQELESFSQNSRLIQSGLNTMQATFVLESIFGGNTIQKVVNGAVLRRVRVNPRNAGTELAGTERGTPVPIPPPTRWRPSLTRNPRNTAETRGITRGPVKQSHTVYVWSRMS